MRRQMKAILGSVVISSMIMISVSSVFAQAEETIVETESISESEVEIVVAEEEIPFDLKLDENDLSEDAFDFKQECEKNKNSDETGGIIVHNVNGRLMPNEDGEYSTEAYIPSHLEVDPLFANDIEVE